jgi:hypothetical protein
LIFNITYGTSATSLGNAAQVEAAFGNRGGYPGYNLNLTISTLTGQKSKMAHFS